MCLLRKEDHIKHPNGSFKEKPCRVCGRAFQPDAPSRLYCSPECSEEGYDHAYLMRTYGMTLNEYRRRLASQEGCCAICRSPGFKMREHHRKLLVVDHDHATGAIRGLLCHNCNRAIGLLKDDPAIIRQAAAHIETHREGATTIPEGSRAKRPEAQDPSGEGEDIVWTRRQRRAAA